MCCLQSCQQAKGQRTWSQDRLSTLLPSHLRLHRKEKSSFACVLTTMDIPLSEQRHHSRTKRIQNCEGNRHTKAMSPDDSLARPDRGRAARP